MRPGPIDGLFGPRTEAAVARLQRAVRLPANGVVDTGTRRVLAGTGVSVRDIPSRPARGDIPPRPLRPLSAVGPGETGPTAGVPAPVVGGAVLLALMLGAMVAWLFAGRELGARPRTAGALAAPDGAGVRALGYVSLPQAQRGDDAGLLRQVGRIDELCGTRGWRLVETVRDVEGDNGKGLDRPGLQYALQRIADGESSCLVVSHIGRLTRSAADLGRILDRLRTTGGRLVAIDVGLDTGSPDGDKAAEALMSIAAWESRRLGERTRKGLAAARAKGRTTGRASVSDVPALKERIMAMRSEGMTLQAIADRLNEEGVPTLRGGKQWRPSSVQAAAGYRRPKRAAGHVDDSAEDAP
jgi:DNA invertase Pin-like site-specific DNA recombinase